MRFARLTRYITAAVALAWIVTSVDAAEPFVHQIPAGLVAPPMPAGAEMTVARVELGKMLYFDKRLSRDNTVSCASCHDPNKGWSNGEPFATGVRGQKGGRNAPTVINAAYARLQFWDGRAEWLEGQALGPIANPIEMDLTLDEAVTRLKGIAGYRAAFKSAFNAEPNQQAMAQAIAAFERTILSGDAPYDRYLNGDKTALSAAAERGRVVFFHKAHCSACHAGPVFSDQAFHNIGVGMNAPKPDIGRMEVSKQLGDRGAFKTPTLRDVARSAPYMHDGSLKTLEEVVEYYAKGGVENPQLDEEIYALQLSAAEKADLVTFLKEGLASSKYPLVAPPKLPE
jgi:cytochrome c peroxidase